KKEARSWLSLRHAEIVRKAWEPPEAQEQKVTKQTFNQYGPQWLDARLVDGRPLKQRTREHYEALLEDHIYPTFGSLPLTSITSDDVRTWHAKLGTTTPTLRAHCYSLLRA